MDKDTIPKPITSKRRIFSRRWTPPPSPMMKMKKKNENTSEGDSKVTDIPTTTHLNQKQQLCKKGSVKVLLTQRD